MVKQIERACDDARRAWDAPGVMRVGSEPKVTLHESVLRRALLLLEKAERERDEARRLAEQLRDEVIVRVHIYELIGPLLTYPDLRLPWEESE
jgi:hypothetical protein